MVSAVELESGQKLLDLGCGAGLVGIAAGESAGRRKCLDDRRRSGGGSLRS